MKKTKRLISMLVSLAMILVMMAVPVYAAGTATVTVGSVVEEAVPGDKISLPVTIKDNPGFTNYEWNIEYDTTSLTLDSITSDMDVVANPDKGGKGFVTYARATAVEGDKTLFTLEFTVKDDAPTGTVEVKIVSDKFNNNQVPVAVDYVAGTVKVAGTGETTPGTGETTPGTGETTPGTGETTPGTGETTPGTGETTPGTGETTPGTGETTPGTGETTPGTGETTPGTGETTPGTGETTPGTGETTPGTGETTPGTGEEVPPVDATPDDNLGDAVIATPLDKVVDAIPFTDDEKALIDSGAVVTIKLVVSDISDTVSAAEQALIEAALDGQTVGMYMDVKLMKRVGTADFSPVTNLSSDIAIKMTLPKELLTADDTMTRTYSVLRIHDGKVEAVATEFDAKTGALTFETDRFSTYAVVYKDVPVEIEVPSTGDTSNLVLWAVVMVLAVGAAAAVVAYKKKSA